uniref:Putative secreted protein n=1 Tax=Anopheles darlingi TaxID=43151 RepID=A0A2M4DJR3_ANODA
MVVDGPAAVAVAAAAAGSVLLIHRACGYRHLVVGNRLCRRFYSSNAQAKPYAYRLPSFLHNFVSTLCEPHQSIVSKYVQSFGEASKRLLRIL